MPCDYRQRRGCDPSVPGGCPCAEVRRNGGPLSEYEIADRMGISRDLVHSIMAALVAKIRVLPPHAQRPWRELLDGWPTARETMWGKAESFVPAISTTEAMKMSRQIVRRWKKLGWYDTKRRALRVVNDKGDVAWSRYSPEDEDAIRSMLGAHSGDIDP